MKKTTPKCDPINLGYGSGEIEEDRFILKESFKMPQD